MNDNNKVVAIADYEVNVKHRIDGNIDTMLNTLCFSEINNHYDNAKKQGKPVLKLHSLISLLERLNNIKQKLKKNNSITILKGLYKGGTSGVYCYQNTPFLFFDIDVSKEKNENVHLLPTMNNINVFERLKKIAVLTWRSSSGNGIAGILYVPQLQDVGNTDTKKHLCIGKAVCNYLQKVLQVNAKFDDAQSRYRQSRYLAKQDVSRIINKNPYVFTYEIKEVYQKLQTGVVDFRFYDNRAIAGTIADQFNRDVSIHEVLRSCNFKKISATRYKHPNTTSSSSGAVKGNVFLNSSSSFSHYKVFTPFFLCLIEQYNGNYKAFLSDLRKKGYNDVKPKKEAYEQAKNNLISNVGKRNEQIFKACYHLINGTYKEKLFFANDNALNDTEKIIFYSYLKIKDFSIVYDKTLFIKQYVEEQLDSVFNYVDVNKKIILVAETGTGKTSSIIKCFNTLRPNERVIILAPLTAIVEQIKADFNNVVCLTGKSGLEEHSRALKSNVVAATYEQGFKHLKETNTFDYVVVDEVHNLITTQGYKKNTIKELTQVLKNKKVIGLTGTANLLFKSIGYKLVNVKKEKQKRVKINFIVDNREPLKIALQHLKKVRGKCIIRVNNRDVADGLEKHLYATKQYKKNEILLLSADIRVKKGKDFKDLTTNSAFNENIKLVITTSLIDEGLSIKQKGFTDVVFIETEYNPAPEPAKQFFARFRNHDLNRKNYYYYRETKNKTTSLLCPYKVFEQTKAELIADAKNFDVLDTDKKDIANTKYLYYNDSTVDCYSLAYDVMTSFFSNITKEEYCFFLEINYNIEVIENKGYQQQNFDTRKIKSQLKEVKKNIAKEWVYNQDEILSALYLITDDKEIKNSIQNTGLISSDMVYNLVLDKLKDFETLQRFTMRLEKLGVNNVNDVLIDSNKMMPVSTQKVNRAICLLENKRTIENPVSITDHKNRGKLLNFVDSVKQADKIDKKTLSVLWEKQRCRSIRVGHYNLLDLYHCYASTG